MTQVSFHKQEMPAYLDKEVSSAKEDKFGHVHLAAALRGLIEDDRHRPPYSVGLLGKWGTGKSTIKGLYLHHLANDETTAGDADKRRTRIHTITFNAWKYGGEADIRKSLFRHIFLEIGGTHEEADRNLYKTVLSTESRRKSFKEILGEFIDNCALGFFVVTLFSALFFILVAVLAWALGFTDPILLSITVLTSGGMVAWLAQKFFSNLAALSPRASVQVTSAPSQTIEEFESLFLSQIRTFKLGRVCSGIGKRVKRIVVFVDDLDRLTADEMVSGLDGIRSLIEMASNEMPKGLGIVFVISCDEERVADALSKRRSYGDLPAAVSSIQDARRYLDRIFQFRLEIPPFPKRDMRNFVLSLLETEYAALRADLRKRGVDEVELVDRMIHPGVQSPRNAIQIVNLFSQCWWLGVLRERDALGSQKAGGMGEGVITQHPLTLAIICVIRADFPDFAQALQRKPRIFDYFLDRFVRPDPLNVLPDEIREELSAFAVEMPDGGAWIVKRQHRGLRQFMSYIQDIRRPYSLQPFLALSQDPVSRRHGDTAVPIEEALRTSDVTALVNAVGLTGSPDPFPEDFGALIGDLVDDLRTETPTIQDNVAYTVVQVEERIPEKDRRRILGLVVRRGGDSSALRWRVGPRRLRELTRYAEEEELRALGRSLIGDITGQESKAVLPSQEPPSLRELHELTDAAASLVLHIISMRKGELPPQAQSEFGEWLLNRTMRIDGQSDQLPVSWLEEKLSEYEGIALPLIREGYPGIIADEFRREHPEPLDLASVVARLDSVFEYFFSQGTQTRMKLWDYLADFVGLRQSALVALASSKFAERREDVPSEARHQIFDTLTARLVQKEEGSEPWPAVDEEEVREALVSTAEAGEAFSAETATQLVRLAQVWSMEDTRSKSATRLYSVIEKRSSEQWAVLNKHWANRLFADLPDTCQQALLTATNQENASDDLRTNVASGIASLEGPQELNDHQIAALSLLLQLLDDSVVKRSPFLEQVNQYIDDTVSLIANNQNGYIISKLQPIRDFLSKIETGKAQELLNSFRQLQPQLLGRVVDTFSGRWPLPASDIATNFGAQRLLDAGLAALDSLGRSDEAVTMLTQLADFQKAMNLERADNADRLVASAYILWSHDQEVAGNVMSQYPTAERTVDQLSGLVSDAAGSGTDGMDVGDRQKKLLVREIEFTTEENVQAVTASLLSQAPAQIGGSPDPALTLWVAAVSEQRTGSLVETLTSESINDEQAVRLFNHMLTHIDRFSAEQYFAMLRLTLIAGDGRERTADAMVRSMNNVVTHLLTADELRRKLCVFVLSFFSEVPNLERKARLVEACTGYGLKNVIVDGAYDGEVSEEDLEIIEKFTGRISKRR